MEDSDFAAMANTKRPWKPRVRETESVVGNLLFTETNATNLTLGGGGDAAEGTYAISLYLPSQTHPYNVGDARK